MCLLVNLPVDSNLLRKRLEVALISVVEDGYHIYKIQEIGITIYTKLAIVEILNKRRV